MPHSAVSDFQSTPAIGAEQSNELPASARAVDRGPSAAGTYCGSSITNTWLIATLFNVCLAPLGQRTSIRKIVFAVPTPK